MSTSAVSKLLAVLFLLFGTGATAHAQFSPDSPVGVSAGLARLFGATNAFSARADVQVLDTNRQETLRTPMGFALLDGKMRMEMDVAQMKGRAVTPTVVAAFKQAGLDKIVSLVRLDKKTVYLVFTGVRSYAKMDMSPADAEAASKKLQIQEAVLGLETVEGHPCSKNKVLVKNYKGALLLAATTWKAKDLKDFPVQIAAQSKDGTTLLRFSQIQWARPAPAQFEPPAGFAKYPSPEVLLVDVARKQQAAAAKTATAKTPAAPKPKSAETKSAATKR